MGWTILTGQNLWTTVTYHKYIWPLQLMDWVRLPRWSKIGISSVWKALLHSLPIIRNNLTWRINDGSKARIGLDPWTGGGDWHHLLRELIHLLNQRDIKVITHITDQDNITIFAQGWKSAHLLDIPPQWHQTWKNYTSALTESHIKGYQIGVIDSYLEQED